MSQDRFRYIDDSSTDGEELIVIGPDSVRDQRATGPVTEWVMDAPEARSLSDFDREGTEAPAGSAAGDFGLTPATEPRPDVVVSPAEEPSGKGVAQDGEFPFSFSERHAEGEVPSPEDSQSDIKVPFLSMQRIILVVMALLVVGFMVYFLCGCSSAKSEPETASKATNKMILQYDLSSDKGSSVSSKAYDVTGDGAPDNVTFKPELSKGATGSTVRSLTLKVNKKEALILSRSQHPELSKAELVSLKLMTLSTGQTYLFLICSGDEGSVLSGLYVVDKGKARPLVTSYSDAKSVWTPVSQMRGSTLVAQAVDDRIAVTVDFNCFVTGQTEATFDFVPSGSSSLSMNSPVATNFGFKASNAQSYDCPSVSAARSFVTYTDESLSTYSFGVSSGDTCVLESLSVSDDKLKFSVKDGEKTGWFAGPRYGYRTYFQETNEVLE